MCQSHLFAIDDGRRQLLFDDVASVEIAGDSLTVRTLVGEPVSLQARICRIDLMKHEIVVEKTTA